jgi:hypothetical protein
MKEILNLPAVALCSVIIKSLITGISIAEALAIVGLAALYGLYYYYESKKEPPLNDSIKAELKNLQDEMNVVKAALQSQKLGTLKWK